MASPIPGLYVAVEDIHISIEVRILHRQLEMHS